MGEVFRVVNAELLIFLFESCSLLYLLQKAYLAVWLTLQRNPPDLSYNWLLRLGVFFNRALYALFVLRVFWGSMWLNRRVSFAGNWGDCLNLHALQLATMIASKFAVYLCLTREICFRLIALEPWLSLFLFRLRHDFKLSSWLWWRYEDADLWLWACLCLSFQRRVHHTC